MNLCTQKYDFHMQFYELKKLSSQLKLSCEIYEHKHLAFSAPLFIVLPTIYFNRLTRPSAAASINVVAVVGVRIAKQQFFRKSLKHRSMLTQWAMKTHHIFQTFIELKTSLFIIIMWIYSFQNGVLNTHTFFMKFIFVFIAST